MGGLQRRNTRHATAAYNPATRPCRNDRIAGVEVLDDGTHLSTLRRHLILDTLTHVAIGVEGLGDIVAVLQICDGSISTSEP